MLQRSNCQRQDYFLYLIFCLSFSTQKLVDFGHYRECDYVFVVTVWKVLYFYSTSSRIHFRFCFYSYNQTCLNGFLSSWINVILVFFSTTFIWWPTQLWECINATRIRINRLDQNRISIEIRLNFSILLGSYWEKKTNIRTTLIPAWRIWWNVFLAHLMAGSINSFVVRLYRFLWIVYFVFFPRK